MALKKKKELILKDIIKIQSSINSVLANFEEVQPMGGASARRKQFMSPADL